MTKNIDCRTPAIQNRSVIVGANDRVFTYELNCRPQAANEAWSMDFVFDRVAGGRALKCLAIVEDATHESVALTREHAVGGQQLVRFLDRLQIERALPQVIRSDNGKEFTGKAILNWLA